MNSASETGDRTLAVLIGDLLPPAADVPTIDAPWLADFAHRHGRTTSLARLQEIVATASPETPFADLDTAARTALLSSIRRQHLPAFADFFLLVIQCYCLDPAVRQAFGDDPAAPFPNGRSLPDGELELLEVVFERGPIFREPPFTDV